MWIIPQMCALQCIYRVITTHCFTLSPQEQASRVQTQLGEEEIKNSKLLQQIAKLEEQNALISQESECKDEVGYSLTFIYSSVHNFLEFCLHPNLM